MIKKKKGFTLIELIVTMAVIAILAAVAVPTSIHLVNKAQDKQKLTIMEDYSARLVEVAHIQDQKGLLDPTVDTCVANLISNINEANPEMSGGYKVLPSALTNDNTDVDYTLSPTYDDVKWNNYKSGEAIVVSFYTKVDENGRGQWYFTLKFYNNGVYNGLSTTKWIRSN